MKCVLCRNGETRTGVTMVPLQRGETIVVLKDVPAKICDNCGEYYLSESVTRKIMVRAERAVKSGAEVAILRYAA